MFFKINLFSIFIFSIFDLIIIQNNFVYKYNLLMKRRTLRHSYPHSISLPLIYYRQKNMTNLDDTYFLTCNKYYQIIHFPTQN